MCVCVWRERERDREGERERPSQDHVTCVSLCAIGPITSQHKD